MTRRLALCVSLLASIFMAACGGSNPSTPGAVPGSPTSSGTARPTAAASVGAVGTTTTGTAAATAQPGAGDGGAAQKDPCGMLTVAEAAGAMDTAPLTAKGTPGDPAKCSYALGDGEEALVIDVLRNGAATQYQAFVAKWVRRGGPGHRRWGALRAWHATPHLQSG